MKRHDSRVPQYIVNPESPWIEYWCAPFGYSGFAILFICVLVGLVLPCAGNARRLLAIGTSVPVSDTLITDWFGGRLPNVVFEAPGKQLVVVQVDAGQSSAKAKAIRQKENVTYVSELGTKWGAFGVTLGLAELTKVDLQQLAFVKSNPDVSQAVIVRVDDSLLRIDLLEMSAKESHLGFSIPNRRIDLGSVVSFEVLGSIPGDRSQGSHVFEVRSIGGRKGVFAVSTGRDGFRGDLLIGGDLISVSNIGGGKHIVATKSHKDLPPSSPPFDAMKQIRDSHPNELEAAALPKNYSRLIDCKRRQSILSTAALSADVFDGPIPTDADIDRIDVGLLFTDGAIRCLAPTLGAPAASVADLLGDILKGVEREFEIDNASAFWADGDKRRHIAVRFYKIGNGFGDDTDVRVTTSQLCRPNLGPVGKSLWNLADHKRADVLVAVVAHACLNKGYNLWDPCAKSHRGLPTPPSCPDLPATNKSPPTCGFTPYIISKKRHQAVTVVDAACLSMGTAFHEIGHLLGAQHADVNLNADGAERFAHGGVATHNLREPNLSLMASVDDCMDKDGNCTYLRKWSSADSNRKEEMIASDGTMVNVVLGGSKQNNLKIIERNFDNLATLGEQRRIEFCKHSHSVTKFASFDSGLPSGKVADEAALSSPDADLRDFLHRFVDLCNDQQYRIFVSGHTDSVGGIRSPENYRLSERRASFIRNEIASLPMVEPHLCKPSALAATRSRAPNSTSAGRAMNRRAEVRITFGNLANCARVPSGM
jgi:outer membrane protein OmpA-like peptidoglycan-associated protein